MGIEVAVYTHLKDEVNSVSSRVYASAAPLDCDTPYIVLNRVSGIRHYTLTSQAGITEARYQFSVFSDGYATAKSTVKEIRDALSAFSGQMGGSGGAYVAACFNVNETDLYESDTKTYHIAVDYVFKYYE